MVLNAVFGIVPTGYLLWFNEPVSYSWNGKNELWIGGVVFYFSSELPYKNAEIFAFFPVLRSPYIVQQFLMGEYFIAI